MYRFLDGRNWLHWKLETVGNVVDHTCGDFFLAKKNDYIMWVQIYLLGTFETERKSQDLEIPVLRPCPPKAPSSLSSDNAWQGPKQSFIFENWSKEFLRKVGLFTYYYINMYHTYFRKRRIYIYISCIYNIQYRYTLYICIWYCIFPICTCCSISTSGFDISLPKSFAMGFP